MDYLPLIITALIAPIVTLLIQKILATGADSRAGRKDLREEIAELWARIDSQDTAIAAKDHEITALRAHVDNLIQWKQRYTSLSLERDLFARQVKDMQIHIEELERKVKDLQAVNANQAGA